MRLDFTNERILAVVAHPDDAELLCAGTLARAKADGAEIGVCVVCTGDKGQPAEIIENLGEVRREEMTAAAAVLEAELLHGGVPDGELFDTIETRRILIELYRRFRPTLVLAHPANDYHADHRTASVLAEAASWFCASAGHLTASPVLEQPPALWWMDTVNMVDFEPGFYVDVGDYVELKRRMLLCHTSQLQRGSADDFSPLEEHMLRQCGMRGAQAGVAAAEAFQEHRAWKRSRAW
jgi:LmbE family N-acetylglucosaminyl deacetylase